MDKEGENVIVCGIALGLAVLGWAGISRVLRCHGGVLRGIRLHGRSHSSVRDVSGDHWLDEYRDLVHDARLFGRRHPDAFAGGPLV